MAAENSPNYAKIGLFMLLGIALIVGALLWFGGAGEKRHNFCIETYFDNDVSGLETGSPVNYRGVHVGTVKKISFIGSEYPSVHPSDSQKVYVLLSLDSRLFSPGDGDVEIAEDNLRDLVGKGLKATVNASGITGLSHIDLNFFPSPDDLSQSVGWRPRHVLVPPQPGLLESLSDSIAMALDQIKSIDFSQAVSNVTEMTTEGRHLVEGLNNLIESQRENISHALDSVRSAAETARETLRTIGENPGAILRDRVPELLPETR